METKWMKPLNMTLSALLIVQLMGCGTILYPERRGQKAGHLDVGVVLLDGIGLLFFLIPGIIAYAVDFSNGTIYLPAGSLSKNDLKEIKFDPKTTTLAEIEGIIKKETGKQVKFSQANMQTTRLESIDEMTARFAEALPSIQNNQVALAVK